MLKYGVYQILLILPRSGFLPGRPASRPNITLISPATGATVSKRDRVFVSVSVQSVYPAKKASLFFDDIFVGSSFSPFSFSFVPESVTATTGDHEITVSITDSVSNMAEARRMITVIE